MASLKDHGTRDRRRFHRAGRGAVLGLLAGIVLFAVQPAVWADSGASQWRWLPWHLTDVYYRIPPVGKFDSLEIDLDIETDVAEGTFLYLSPFWGRLDETGFYFGFQTDQFAPGTRKSLGKGIIFSRWGKGSKDDIRVPPDGWSHIGDRRTSGEGDYVSVRRTVPWGRGRYTFVMRVRNPFPSSSGTWIDLLLYDHAKGTWTDAGGLRFPGSRPRLRKGPAGFLEVYYAPGTPLADIPTRLPDLEFTIGWPVFNRNLAALSSKVIFDKRVPRLVNVDQGPSGVRISLDAEAHGHMPRSAAPQRLPAAE